MSLKAGRVGVNPADVDPVSGHVNPSAVDSYTKSQADTKFLDKSDASSTYLSKSDAASTYETKEAAADLQPKRLSVPISMLNGSKATVEEMLISLNEEELAYTDLIEGATVEDTVGNHLYRIGRLVVSVLALNGVTAATPYSTVIAKVPAALKPKSNIYNTITGYTAIINTAGELVFNTTLSNATVRVMCAWVI